MNPATWLPGFNFSKHQDRFVPASNLHEFQEAVAQGRTWS